MADMAIKDLIRAGRERLQMTEQRFADAAGVSRSAVQQWERGTTAPKRRHQQRVADLIGVTVGELMSGESPKYPTTATPGETAQQAAAPYTVSMPEEARHLMEKLNPEGQRQALAYMRFLTQTYPVEQSGSDNQRDQLPTQPKAA